MCGFVNENTEQDLNKKTRSPASEVERDVLDERVRRDARDRTNDLPHDDTTGVSSVAPDDPAYQYDRNPISIAEQSLT